MDTTPASAHSDDAGGEGVRDRDYKGSNRSCPYQYNADICGKRFGCGDESGVKVRVEFSRAYLEIRSERTNKILKPCLRFLSRHSHYVIY